VNWGILVMSEYSTNEIAKNSPEIANDVTYSTDLSANNHHDNHETTSDEFSELRSLLLGVEPTKLNKIYERLENPQIQPEDISRLLPKAIILRSMQDNNLTEAIVPTVEDAIDYSVKKDLNILSNAIFPIVGRATRKAISTTLSEMIQSLNQTLEHSVSPQSFKWRLEARQTGKSFAEVVLLRTLIYRVEQVFLIHKTTGLLLQNIVALHVAAQDPDLVSAMLTAIQDFVKDSFTVKKDDGLQSLHFGELTIWIEEGPQAILAGIIRGNAPQELRLVFQEAIEQIHLKLNAELNAFQGETDPFAASKPYLQACFEARYTSPPKKNYTYAWGLFGAIAIACGIWSFLAIKEQLRWNAYLAKLSSQPGLVVIAADKRHGKYFISGMRDPLAADPNLLMQQANINPKTAIAEWKPYLSLETQLIAKRAEALLQPPKTVSLQVDENGILEATGSASRQWIAETQKLARFIPGVTQFQSKNLVVLELSQLESYKNQIEQEMFFFLEGTIELSPGEENKLKSLALKVQNLLYAANYLGKNVRIQIIGHANTTGTEQQNMILSENRAKEILSYLNSQGINTTDFSITGIGSSQALHSKYKQEDKQFNRRVSFKVYLTDISS
jgi:outer membrane protein OmpA-like peptidoglycan-associated protein